jgi:hypothetical protein
VSPTQETLAPVVARPLQELLWRVEHTDLLEVLKALMLKGQSQCLGVTIQFHAVSVIVGQPIWPRMRELVVEHLLKEGAAYSFSESCGTFRTPVS